MLLVGRCEYRVGFIAPTFRATTTTTTATKTKTLSQLFFATVRKKSSLVQRLSGYLRWNEPRFFRARAELLPEKFEPKLTKLTEPTVCPFTGTHRCRISSF